MNQHYEPIWTAIIGAVVGPAEPASGSTVTATTPRVDTSTGPGSMWNADPGAVGWKRPAGRGAPPFGISHISKIFPGSRWGRFEEISRTPVLGFTKTLPRGGAGWPLPKPTCWVSG